ncbi:MAG: class I SAM-dependent methyltransferase [Defluviitaleaceae bacterium]|nr:class I SAM-dependent methyltransferase [Defluviitaleaceae bacterium]
MDKPICKICGGECFRYAHTAKCQSCGVLLYYPYPSDEDLAANYGDGDEKTDAFWIDWYTEASFLNHTNFTNMFRFTVDRSQRGDALTILDYGGGGGQFALVAASHLLKCTVYITDMCDSALRSSWAPVNRQIRFADFETDETRFDVIFLNDVFEHVSDPLNVLRLLIGKLNEGGRLFIDTPKQFWLYPVLKLIAPPLYRKLLRGTVSTAHLQIWSRKSFEQTVKQAGFRIIKYKEISEFTMPPQYYLKNMGVKNPLIKLMGILFYRNAKWLARNKILCVCEKL